MSADYHLNELRIARDPNSPKHILPPQVPLSHRVLDVGCGAGQTLIAAYPDRISFGLDIDFDALRLGRSLTDRIRFLQGAAEHLPYKDAQFDLVIARVSLPYSDIGASLKEIRRVLRPGGAIWATLHPPAVPWKQCKQSNYRGKVLFAYVLLNSILFHIAQRQFRFRGRYESFQTDRGMRRALTAAGFEEIGISRGAHYLATARAK